MKLWDISGDGFFWKVHLDVRDLGERGHLDFTNRARAGTLWCCYGWCLAPLVFRSSWVWFGVSKFLLVFMQRRPPMCLLHRFVPSWQLLFGRSGLVKCLWLTLLRFLICLTVRLVWIWRCVLSGSGFV